LTVGLAITVAAVSMEQTVAFLFQDRLLLDARNTSKHVGIALVIYGLTAVFAQGFIVRRLKWGPRALLRTGIPFAFAGLIGLALAQRFATLTAALAVQALGQGLALPGITSAISLSVGEHEQGGAAGLNSSSQALGRLIGPLVGTALYQFAPPYPYFFGAALLAMIMLTLIVRPRLAGRYA
jgi:MFS family permease